MFTAECSILLVSVSLLVLVLQAVLGVDKRIRQSC